MTEEKKDSLGGQGSFLSAHEEVLRILNQKKGNPEVVPEMRRSPEAPQEVENPNVEAKEVLEPMPPPEVTPKVVTPKVEQKAVPPKKKEPVIRPIAKPVVVEKPKPIIVPMSEPEKPRRVDKPEVKPIPEPKGVKPSNSRNEPPSSLKKSHVLIALVVVGLCAGIYLNQLSKSKQRDVALENKTMESQGESPDANIPLPFDPAVLPAPIRVLSDELGKGLYAYWAFDETEQGVLVDSSGRGRNGTLLHGLSFSKNAVSGIRGSALQFDGVDDGIKFPSVPVEHAITVSVWARIGQASPYEHMISNHPGWFLSLNQGSIRFAVQVEGKNTKENEATVSFSKINILGLGWHHYVGVYDGAVLYAYLDGKLASTKPLSGKIKKGDGSRIGRYWRSQGTRYQWTGAIDEVRIYNRALSAGEVAELHQWSAL